MAWLPHSTLVEAQSWLDGQGFTQRPGAHTVEGYAATPYVLLITCMDKTTYQLEFYDTHCETQTAIDAIESQGSYVGYGLFFGGKLESASSAIRPSSP